ncbi:hypothetical protein GQ42DRAFT_121272 [Ramicandelaber brevisporus]|nr:hypothetical protein GQ42DRAFT_121272 [Ramicandelaber brevisporus]
MASVLKPRSMATGQRNVIRAADSASLWNCTLSPGWSREEVEILRQALIKLGIGNWVKIHETGCLPGKTIAQMNLQTQRMLGQQSTAEFAGLHIDCFKIGEINSQRQGPDVKRKNGFIVNTGGKLTRDEIVRRIKKNRELYEEPRETWDAIELLDRTAQFVPSGGTVAMSPEITAKLNEKRAELDGLQKELAQVRAQIAKLQLNSDAVSPKQTPDIQISSDNLAICDDFDVDIDFAALDDDYDLDPNDGDYRTSSNKSAINRKRKGTDL